MKTKALARDLLLGVLMLGAGLAVLMNPADKAGTETKLALEKLVPRDFEGWQSETYDTADYRDEKYKSINQLLIREYFKENTYGLKGGVKRVRLIIEYSSDLRNNFSFHFPENCHRSDGNAVEFLGPIQFAAPEGHAWKAKSLFIKGLRSSPENHDKLVAYWLVIGGKHHHETFFVKLDQMAAGLFSGSKSGFLVRLDFEEGLSYSQEGIQEAREVLSGFMTDLYFALNPEQRKILFGN